MRASFNTIILVGAKEPLQSVKPQDGSKLLLRMLPRTRVTSLLTRSLATIIYQAFQAQIERKCIPLNLDNPLADRALSFARTSFSSTLMLASLREMNQPGQMLQVKDWYQQVTYQLDFS